MGDQVTLPEFVDFETQQSVFEAFKALAELVRDLLDDEECVLDHDGHCQAHGWLSDERPCPNGRGRQLLELFGQETGPWSPE